MIPHCICLILRFFPFALGVYDILSNWSCQSHDPSRISFLFEKNICRKDCSIHGIAMVWSCKTSGWGKHSRNGHGKSPLLLSTQDLCYFLYLLLQVHQKPAKRLNRHQIEVKLLKLLNFLHSASFSHLSFFRFSATRFNFCLLYTLGSTFYGNHVNPY